MKKLICLLFFILTITLFICNGYIYALGNYWEEPADSQFSVKVISRFKENPIIKPRMPGLEGKDGANINGPSLIRVPDWVENPLGRYYLYFAHHNGLYIRMAYADDLHGPWTIYKGGVLRFTQTLSKDHVASPDIIIDDENKEIRMYYHGKYKSMGTYSNYKQVSLIATSNNGLDFKSTIDVLGPFYFRVFQYDGYYYAIAKNQEVGGILLRSKDGRTEFEKGPKILPAMRHAALLLKGDTLLIFYSMIGDTPEHIVMSEMKLTGDWSTWKPSPPRTILQPEEVYEGADLPLKKSVYGVVSQRVHELRDPAIFVEDGRVYLLYSIAGESGIAIAEIEITEN